MRVLVFSVAVLFFMFGVTMVWGAGEPGLNPNLIPMFAGVEKTEAQIATDKKFIAEAAKAAGGREKGSQEFVKMAWKAFFAQRDPATAMMRFNQAWLLNPENHEVLWGFGVVSGAMGKMNDSVKLLRQASEELPGNARVLADLGFSLTLFANEPGNTTTAHDIFAEAFACFARAEKLEPDYEPLFSNWAVALFANKDFAGAWEKIIKAEKLGGKTINPMFLKDLESKMARPDE